MKNGYYSSGEFARMAHVTLRTIRYYDKINILKPSCINEYGARFYTDADLAKLQQILLFKYLGFSLDEIRDMTVGDPDYHYMENVLQIQTRLIEDRIEQMQLVKKAIEDTTAAIQARQTIDWSQMLKLIHLTGIESSMKNQYQNASNISARIKLHSLYSHNKQGWFPWIFEQLMQIIHILEDAKCTLKSTDAIIKGKKELHILEIGCGDGSLWNNRLDCLPKHISVTLSDISEGMLRDARRTLEHCARQCDFEVFDCHTIPYTEQQFDIVIANHVLFYCDDIAHVCGEIKRILKPDGYFLCSTYGRHHMEEINNLVYDFDQRIILSAQRLYERFGKENGSSILEPYFQNIIWQEYDDYLEVSNPEDLIAYVLSCHGNQNQYILDRYQDFRNYVKEQTLHGYHITKEAGIFCMQRKK